MTYFCVQSIGRKPDDTHHPAIAAHDGYIRLGLQLPLGRVALYNPRPLDVL